MELFNESTVFLDVKVTPVGLDGAVIDPLDPLIPVSVAVVPINQAPKDIDFKEAEWVKIGRDWNARVLVGPDSSVGPLAKGTYKAWVLVSIPPEEPKFAARDFIKVI